MAVAYNVSRQTGLKGHENSVEVRARVYPRRGGRRERVSLRPGCYPGPWCRTIRRSGLFCPVCPEMRTSLLSALQHEIHGPEYGSRDSPPRCRTRTTGISCLRDLFSSPGPAFPGLPGPRQVILPGHSRYPAVPARFERYDGIIMTRTISLIIGLSIAAILTIILCTFTGPAGFGYVSTAPGAVDIVGGIRLPGSFPHSLWVRALPLPVPRCRRSSGTRWQIHTSSGRPRVGPWGLPWPSCSSGILRPNLRMDWRGSSDADRLGDCKPERSTLGRDTAPYRSPSRSFSPHLSRS